MKKYHLKHNSFFWDGLGISADRVAEMDIQITNLMLKVGSDEIPNSQFLFNGFMDIAKTDKEAVLMAFEAGRRMEALDREIAAKDN